jgi:hypothetical protein
MIICFTLINSRYTRRTIERRDPATHLESPFSYRKSQVMGPYLLYMGKSFKVFVEHTQILIIPVY